jgi:hypothetical protein
MFMKDNDLYKLEEYFEKKYKKEIIDQIKNFEFPNEWTPSQVVDYITYKIDRK